MTEASDRFSLPFILPGQAQKEAYHNEALARIDAALHACIEGDPTADIPFDPAVGESWVVAPGAAGAWAGKAQNLATWTASGWRFTAPVPGMTVWNIDAGYRIAWTGSAWTQGEWATSTLTIGGQQVVGPRLETILSPSGGTTIDTEARDSLDAVIVALRTHGLIE
jgi:hypothetical protein